MSDRAMDEKELMACPHCGEPAEMDTQQFYLRIDGKGRGSAVAIYCTKCPSQIRLCREDYEGFDTDNLMALATEQWNTRAQPINTFAHVDPPGQAESGEVDAELAAHFEAIDHANLIGRLKTLRCRNAGTKFPHVTYGTQTEWLLYDEVLDAAIAALQSSPAPIEGKAQGKCECGKWPNQHINGYCWNPPHTDKYAPADHQEGENNG